MVEYKSDIILGDRYRDEQTGYEGVATGVFFYQHACERVNVESYDYNRQTVIETIFDSPRLVHIETGEKATTTRTGGPARFGENMR